MTEGEPSFSAEIAEYIGKRDRQPEAGRRVRDFFEREGKRSAVQQVIDKFKYLFQNRILKAGDRIPTESELAETMDTGRGTIREAVKILVGYGILEIRRGYGTYVSTDMGDTLFDHLLFQILVSDYDQRNLVELRELMEYGVVVSAIARQEPGDVEPIEQAHELVADLVRRRDYDPKKLCDGERLFHLGISRATHNELVHRIYSFVLELVLPTIEKTYERKREPEDFQVIVDTHQDILDGIKSRDRAKGRRAVADSLTTWVYAMDRFS